MEKESTGTDQVQAPTLNVPIPGGNVLRISGGTAGVILTMLALAAWQLHSRGWTLSPPQASAKEAVRSVYLTEKDLPTREALEWRRKHKKQSATKKELKTIESMITEISRVQAVQASEIGASRGEVQQLRSDVRHNYDRISDRLDRLLER